MTELGKAAKHMGHSHPRVLRKTDPDPLRPTPSAKPRRKSELRFGYSAECKWPWCREWEVIERWYRTAKSRDQALAAERRRVAKFDWYRNLKPIEKE